MHESDLISLVVTTYNRSDALELVVNALQHQTDTNFEIIIADDGSNLEHRTLIARIGQASSISFKHVWHPDVGFTASKVRNLGVANARGKYIILLDGDCVHEMDFVSRHRSLREEGTFVNGSRVLLSELFTHQLLSETPQIASRSSLFWLRQGLRGNSNKLAPRLRLPDFALRRQKRFVWKGIRSCNMGVWRSDYEAVNGFDETFVGWGHEDADFVLRLHNAGLIRKNGFFSTEVYHLWHKESVRTYENDNSAKVRMRMKTGQLLATTGYEESLDATDVLVQSWG
jgi:glycosyltransferase involved in cell wall biosynthesis